MRYLLHEPFYICAHLLTAIKVDGKEIRGQVTGRNDEGRTCYRFDIDGLGVVDDVRSGCQGGTLQKGFESLFSFLSAAAESYAYGRHTGRKTENADLFALPIVEWAHDNANEISDLALLLEEETLIEEKP